MTKPTCCSTAPRTARTAPTAEPRRAEAHSSAPTHAPTRRYPHSYVHTHTHARTRTAHKPTRSHDHTSGKKRLRCGSTGGLTDEAEKRTKSTTDSCPWSNLLLKPTNVVLVVRADRSTHPPTNHTTLHTRTHARTGMHRHPGVSYDGGGNGGGRRWRQR
jgi:hypothetical protein